MTYLRAAIGTTLLLVIALFIFIFISFDAEYELNTAKDYFLKEDYERANAILSKLKGSLSPSQWLLDKAYVLRAQQQIEESNLALQQALSDLDQNKKQSGLLLEILLNQAFNAYLNLDLNGMQAILDKAQEDGVGQEPWVLFFVGITKLFNENYTQALQEFTKPLPSQWLSPWMKKSFGGVFTPTWLSLNVARCEIELGRFVQARNYLEGLIPEIPKENRDEIFLLIGLSYIKEADEKSSENAVPYLKMAFSYFNRIPILQERFEKDRQQILAVLNKKTLGLVEEHQFVVLPFLITIYENWHAHQALQMVSDRLIKILQDTQDNIYSNRSQELLNLLNRTLPEGELRDSVRKYYDSLIFAAITKGDFSQMEGYLNAERQFRQNLSISEELAAEAYVFVWELLPVDQASLPLMSNYLNVWKALIVSREPRELFAKNLQAMAEELLERGAQEEKALNLIQLSYTLQ